MPSNDMSIRAIARKLKISPTAVSLALRASPRVSPELRKRIEKEAEEIGYIPNARVSELMNEVRKARTPGFHSAIAAFSLFPQKEPWTEKHYEHLQEVYEGARTCAESHGYKLELHWLKAPGMTPKRFRRILEARAIRGLYCLGSLDPDENLPDELSNFAIVSHGTSVSSNLHRVRSYFSNDCLRLLNILVERGYKRIGFLIKTSGDRRTNFSYTSTFVGFHERVLSSTPLSILRLEEWEENRIFSWYETIKPDALILHHDPQFVLQLERALQNRQIKIPSDLGLVILDKPPNLNHSGIIQNTQLMGSQAMEILIGRILIQEFHLPSDPRVELVAGDWNEGKTIRSAC